jgi:hypothetical protein
MSISVTQVRNIALQQNHRATLYTFTSDGSTTSVTCPVDGEYIRPLGDKGLAYAWDAPAAWGYPSGLGGLLVPTATPGLANGVAATVTATGTVTLTLGSAGTNGHTCYILVVWNPDRPAL